MKISVVAGSPSIVYLLHSHHANLTHELGNFDFSLDVEIKGETCFSFPASGEGIVSAKTRLVLGKTERQMLMSMTQKMLR